jgi:hypothetical protein
MSPVIEGTATGTHRMSGAPGAGTNEVQTMTIDATGGTFKLAFGGFTTGDITWSATNNTLLANINNALQGKPSRLRLPRVAYFDCGSPVRRRPLSPGPRRTTRWWRTSTPRWRPCPISGPAAW